jgi:DNA-binding response OmpR family regulator
MTDYPILLIADDDRAIRDTLFEAFADRGFRTIVAADGEQTLRIAQREPIDIVLVDMYMPRLTGLDTVRRLNVLSHPPACVLMSSAMDEQLRQAALDARATAVLEKPFTLDLAMQTLLNVWHG